MLCEVAVVSLWFSATAIIPSLIELHGLAASDLTFLTSATQIGFVFGTFASAVLMLADRLDPRRFFMAAALIGALVNGMILLAGPTAPLTWSLRFITGACMAGTYPVALKMASGWAKGDLGLLVAILSAGMTVGNAAPHMFDALGGVDWRVSIAVSSVLATLSAVMINFVGLGPGHVPSPPFDASFHAHGGLAEPSFWARLATFATMGLGGAMGCLLGGVLSDRKGRTWLTMWSMAISGSCALAAGFAFGANPWVVSALCLVWGVAVVADSAQFAAAITELSPPELAGTMITVQTLTGFTLTLIALHFLPILAEWGGWPFPCLPWARCWASSRWPGCAPCPRRRTWPAGGVEQGVGCKRTRGF